jgi:hypothetical protein
VDPLDVRRTPKQEPRGTRPDAVGDGVAHLIKANDHLRLTYQIRLLTSMAAEQRLRLLIHVPAETRISDPLAAFVEAHSRIVSVERSR